MVLTLFGRLYYVQLLDPNKPSQTADRLHLGDDRRAGAARPDRRLARTVARRQHLGAGHHRRPRPLRRAARPRRGRARPARRAAARSTASSPSEITPCSPKVPAPCWTGEPYQPVPVATNAPTSVVLAVSEHREEFPGVAIQTVTLPNYPDGTLAAHVLGYTGADHRGGQARRPEAHRRRHDRASAASSSSTTACCAASTASSRAA